MTGKAIALSLCVITGIVHLQAQQAVVAGITLDIGTGKPLSNVHVRLILGMPDASPILYGAISDAVGHFSIATVIPGTYNLQPEHAGFVYLASRTFTLKVGQSITDLRLEMVPEAVISGHVLDEYGDPVQGVEVSAEPLDPAEYRFQMPPSGSTDERGDFRLHGAPGKYRILADLHPAPVVVTWYPASLNKDSATILDASSGKELVGVDIHLKRQRGLTISGEVTGMPAGAEPVFVFLNAAGVAFEGPRMTPVHEGKFAVTNVQPGAWRLRAEFPDRSGRRQSRWVDIRVDTSDVSGVQLPLIAPEDLTGKLEMAGDLTGTTVVLEPVGREFGSQPSGGEADKDGAFSLQGVYPGQYRVDVRPLIGNSYVKDVKLNGTSVEGTLDLSRGVNGSTLNVTVSPNGGEIEGTVISVEGEPIRNAPGTVFLFSDAEELIQRAARAITPDGRYVIKGTRPGKYRLTAVAEGRLAESGDLKELAAAGEQIEVTEGAHIAKALKLNAPK